MADRLDNSSQTVVSNLRELLADAQSRFIELGIQLGQQMIALPAAFCGDQRDSFRLDAHSSLTVTDEQRLKTLEQPR